MSIKLFFQKLIPFLKKRGFKGLVTKVLQKLHVVPEQARVLEDFEFIVDQTKIPFIKREYELHKEDEVKILNWIIPEMGKVLEDI